MKKPLILIVEDDPVLRDMTQRQLAALGFDSCAVSTGEEAIEKATDEEIGLILMDIGLPGIDGSHATELIREKESEAHRKRVPVIALTAHPDRLKCMQAGMDDFMQKPALLGDIKKMVDKWLLAS
jgi:two-component system sensor histidine kinase/response regulator